MRRDRIRTADPFAPAERHILSSVGVDTQPDLRRRDRDNNIRTPDKHLVVVCSTLGPFYREDVGSTGAAAYGTRLATPTAIGTFSSVAIGYRAASAGVVVRAHLWSNAARTNGTCYLRVRITDGAAVATDYDFTDCALTGTAHPEFGYSRTQNVSQALTITDGVPFAAGDLIEVRFVTDASWAPTTADLGAQIVIASTEWIDG